MPDRQFWNQKRVLLTGHTGFKGSWLALWLNRLGAEVFGIALDPDTTPALFNLASVEPLLSHHIVDIRDPALKDIVRTIEPEIVIHMAAQSLVRRSYSKPVETFSTNVMGTANVLQAICKLDSVQVAVMVTTDKVYLNHESGIAFKENDPLGGHDPYSASKAASEIVIDSYRKSFLDKQGVAIASARAGNVIGGGDWSSDRLIPDAIRAWQHDDTLQIRMPDAVRPWQHVLEPLSGYLNLAEMLWKNRSLAGAYNFGPDSNSVLPVRNIIELAINYFGRGKVSYSPQTTDLHEAGLLLLDTEKLKTCVGVKPALLASKAVELTINWYAKQIDGVDARQLCLDDIVFYETLQ